MNGLSALWHQVAGLGAARLRAGLGDLALLAAIGLCLVGAAGFGLAALHHVLRPLVGPAGASALLGATLVILALGLALWRSERRHAAVLHVPPVVPVAEPEVAAPDPATAAAFLAGFLLARRLF